MVASALSSSAVAETYEEIPFLSEISAAGFNVHMRKSEPATPETVAQPAVPAKNVVSQEKPDPAPAPAPTEEIRDVLESAPRLTLKGKDGSVKNLGLTSDGFLTVDGVKSFYLKPGPVKISYAAKKEMKSVDCARPDAKNIKMGYVVYSRDNKAIGYMSDYTLRPGSHLDTFRVVSFPEVFGKSVCLEFDGTNPYPDNRVGNQPKVKVTLDEISAGLPF
jgi:hypothetical protein